MKSYVLIVVPPEEEIAKINHLRQVYNQYTSYVIPPHFTVYPPFQLVDTDEQTLINLLGKGFNKVAGGQILTEGFGYFQGKNNVVFLNPNPSSETLLKQLLILAAESMAGKVKFVYPDYNFTPEKFKPHMTIAERIPGDKFEGVKSNIENQKIRVLFNLHNIFLYSNDKGSNIWSKIANIPLD